MRPDILYSRLPNEDSANNADHALIADLMQRHITIPVPLRLSFACVIGWAGRWFIGAMTFDELVDQLGKVADQLNEINNTAGYADNSN